MIILSGFLNPERSVYQVIKRQYNTIQNNPKQNNPKQYKKV